MVYRLHDGLLPDLTNTAFSLLRLFPAAGAAAEQQQQQQQQWEQQQEEQQQQPWAAFESILHAVAAVAHAADWRCSGALQQLLLWLLSPASSLTPSIAAAAADVPVAAAAAAAGRVPWVLHSHRLLLSSALQLLGALDWWLLQQPQLLPRVLLLLQQSLLLPQWSEEGFPLSSKEDHLGCVSLLKLCAAAEAPGVCCCMQPPDSPISTNNFCCFALHLIETVAAIPATSSSSNSNSSGKEGSSIDAASKWAAAERQLCMQSRHCVVAVAGKLLAVSCRMHVEQQMRQLVQQQQQQQQWKQQLQDPYAIAGLVLSRHMDILRGLVRQLLLLKPAAAQAAAAAAAAAAAEEEEGAAAAAPQLRLFVAACTFVLQSLEAFLAACLQPLLEQGAAGATQKGSLSLLFIC